MSAASASPSATFAWELAEAKAEDERRRLAPTIKARLTKVRRFMMRTLFQQLDGKAQSRAKLFAFRGQSEEALSQLPAWYAPHSQFSQQQFAPAQGFLTQLE